MKTLQDFQEMLDREIEKENELMLERRKNDSTRLALQCENQAGRVNMALELEDFIKKLTK